MEKGPGHTAHLVSQRLLLEAGLLLSFLQCHAEPLLGFQLAAERRLLRLAVFGGVGLVQLGQFPVGGAE